MVRTFDITIGQVYNGTELCNNPVVTLAGHQDMAISCLDADNGVYRVQVDTTDENPCLTFIVQCEECGTCPAQVIEKCICDDINDCADCEICNSDGFCEPLCDPEDCDNGQCVECRTADDCPCNQVCDNGECRCPAGTTLNSETGCCDECSTDDDCEECEECIQINGAFTCVAKECTGGVCDENTGNCVECVASGDCTGDNECCVNNKCVCCPGYKRDANGDCVYNPCDFDDDCDVCEYCDPLVGCVPLDCPAGSACNPLTGACEPQCDNDCPDGEGCINGFCVPCDQLDCVTGQGLQCEFAEGCHCVDGDCEWIDCDPDTVSVEWVITQATQGDIVTPGLPALTATHSATPNGLTVDAPIYQEHTFNLQLTNATYGGSWTINNGLGTIPLASSTTNVSFNIADAGGNYAGFIVEFIEANTGRTATFGIYRDPTAPLVDPNVWTIEFQSTGTSPTTSGGSPGSVKLCANNGNFRVTSVTNVSTTGDIAISFVADGTGCLTASITGCGTWNGDAVLDCGGTPVTVPIPEFVRDPANCCEPTDPSCSGTSQGDPCIEPTVVNIDLVAHPTYGVNGDGDGEFFVQLDFASAGLSFIEIFYLLLGGGGCWNTTQNADLLDPLLSDLTINGGGPSPTSPTPLGVFVTMGYGGCIGFGKICTVQLPGCEVLEGELCMDECGVFSVEIVPQVAPNTYKAFPSLSDESVNYTWTYPNASTEIVGAGQTVTIAPVGGSNVLAVSAIYNGKCSASDQLLLSTDVFGCRDITACNYDPLANRDSEEGCCIVSPPTYDCASGLLAGLSTSACEGTVDYEFTGMSGTSYYSTGAIPADTYTVKPRINGVVCDSISWTIAIPQCYRCVLESCDPATPNTGGWPDDSNCGGECSCAITDPIVSLVCDGDGSVTLTLKPSGGLGFYDIIVKKGSDIGVNVYDSTNGGTTPLAIAENDTIVITQDLSADPLCPDSYWVQVTDGPCTKSFTADIDVAVCDVCDYTPLDISISQAFSCQDGPNPATVGVLITADNCVEGSYTVKVQNQPCGVSATPIFTQAIASPDPAGNILTLGTDPASGTWYVLVEAVIDGTTCCAYTSFTANCDGAACVTIVDDMTYSVPALNTLNFVVDWSQLNGSGTVNWALHRNVLGGCSDAAFCEALDWTTAGADYTVLTSGTSVESTPGSGSFNINGVARDTGLGNECYRVVLTDSTTGSCIGYYYLCVPAGATEPADCIIDMVAVKYEPADEGIYIQWISSGTTSGPPSGGGLNAELNIYSGACPPAGAPTTTYTHTGLGENSSGWVRIDGNYPQLNADAQCFTVYVYDPIASSCHAAGEADGVLLEMEGTIPQCTCAVVDLQTTYYASIDELHVDWTIDCPSVPISIDINLDSYAVAGCAGVAVNVDSTTVTTATGTHIFSVPQTAVDTYYKVWIQDNVDFATGCVDTSACLTIPADPTACPAGDPYTLVWDGQGVVDYVSELAVNGVKVLDFLDPDLDMTNAGDRTTLQGLIDGALSAGATSAVTSVAGVHSIVLTGALESDLISDVVVTNAAADSYFTAFMTGAGCGLVCDRSTVIQLQHDPTALGCGGGETVYINGVYVEDTNITGATLYDITDNSPGGDMDQLVLDVDAWLVANGYTGSTSYQVGGISTDVDIDATDAQFTYITIECSGGPGVTVQFDGTTCGA